MHMAKYLILGILLCLMAKAKTREAYILSAEVNFNRIYLEDHRIEILPGNVSLNLVYTLAKDQSQEQWWALDIDVKNRRSQRYRNLFRTGPVNTCTMMKSLKNKILLVFLKEFMKRGKFSNECPFKKANFTWLGLNAKNMNVPQFFAGLYRALVINYFQRDGKKDVIANDTIHWEVK